MEFIKEYSNRVAIEYYSKHSGHGELKQGYDFDKLFNEAIREKDNIIRKELADDAIDITLYIGVMSDDRFAIVYATREYYNLMKGHIDNEYAKQFVDALEDFIDGGGKPKIYEYTNQVQMRLDEAND